MSHTDLTGTSKQKGESAFQHGTEYRVKPEKFFLSNV